MTCVVLMQIVNNCYSDSVSAAIMQSSESCLSWNIALGELLTIIVAIAATWIGITQYKSSKKDTWFLNVIVLPLLDPLKKYYLELLNDLEKDKIDIGEKRQMAHEDFIIYLAELKQQRKSGINDNFDHIIALVRSYDKKLGDKVNEVVMNLEDEYVEILDKYSADMDVKEREIILGNEQNMLTILNSSMNKN